jgi:hypothetical protein
MQAQIFFRWKSSNRKIKDGLKYATKMVLDRTNQQHYHNENGSRNNTKVIGLQIRVYRSGLRPVPWIGDHENARNSSDSFWTRPGSAAPSGYQARGPCCDCLVKTAGGRRRSASVAQAAGW